METPRLLFVHAHPDDETLTTGATIAHYAARGADVRVLTCTLGEEGEVIGSQWAQLAVDGADQLGGYRIGELSLALKELGVDQPRYLGGAGRWRDSGMEGSPARHRERFADADMDEAVGALVAVLRDFRPHVVVTYDPNGGYGHPDHIQAHRVTTAAVAASAGDGHPGEPWQVPKFYWTVMDGESMAEALESINEVELPDSWVRIPASALPFDLGHRIDAVIDAQDSLPAKVAAMRAHQTQVTVEPSGRVFALSNNIALPISAVEHYLLVDGAAGERDDRGVETDLLSGINLA
ncbi:MULTISPECIES: N-acetyl-1-D-myo-inositol-2-amino-2-deoxy-alpha-D-glucopyranoside deacetylase [Mycolicibacterium]|uniref:1D-myo-inositol 2-acetamido-2-deoxy-alpha-D-glucopyranoside deacetylase n=1 Tax=Mycolicibacterium phocaicum TaxID=319706 RepID=A0AA94RCW0_9MYCO|nr:MULTISPECIES: N-acetyl-1-D-myo-inositol-2-amino-2-deoxy-alpha-D-glucopyranoside deacetylase [Mycolicibacterium]MCX8556567.1 N-acetyl-1-D-myo-inositol-2-amino-2-deoxy-alpha-D-glucopyranoside deacetylase [Mycolicibacterium mucogenicum]TLH66623.1 N-acetyl-1-D-myo-inositol-2-amino-2-deoxy-alpha-D-glucopyranoside deacetylase [Mycolicibacterium phocaicum]